jgi:hypothetical protein
MRIRREITHLLCMFLMPKELEVFLQLYGNSTRNAGLFVVSISDVVT